MKQSLIGKFILMHVCKIKNKSANKEMFSSVHNAKLSAKKYSYLVH